MEKIGFTIGKFAPFHKGHEYLIETALKQTDKVYVIVNDAQEINTPIETRAKWIKDQYPQVEIIYGYHPPKQYGMDEKSVAIQIEYLKELTKGIHPTHFFSSEPYGAKVSEYMQVKDCRVDPQRKNVPISATMIRQDLEKNKKYIHEEVYQEIKDQFQKKKGEQK